MTDRLFILVLRHSPLFFGFFPLSRCVRFIHGTQVVEQSRLHELRVHLLLRYVLLGTLIFDHGLRRLVESLGLAGAAAFHELLGEEVLMV